MMVNSYFEEPLEQWQFIGLSRRLQEFDSPTVRHAD